VCSSDLYPTCTDLPASSILKKYPQFSLILCGDNHRTFVEEYEERLLVNPGSLMRMDADQIDHKPSIFLWYSDNSVKQIFLPIEEGVVTRTHLVEKEERNARMDAFVTKLNDDYKTTVSFEENLTQFFSANEVDPETKQIIYNVIE
jgi:DNA repair exonuclease SbcCD nuclease subunit